MNFEEMEEKEKIYFMGNGRIMVSGLKVIMFQWASITTYLQENLNWFHISALNIF